MQAARLTEHIARWPSATTATACEQGILHGISRRPVSGEHHQAPQGNQLPGEQPDLVKHAREQKAEREVIEVLENLPDRDYGNMADVMKAMGEAE